MAIYHCNISVVSRANGHSAVAGAAYLSRSNLVNQRDGLRHDFTRAHQHERLVADLGIALPERAPERLLDRSTLWNEVERIEKRADAQLCRRIEYALPDELSLGAQLELARRVVEDYRRDGMAVDACVHQNVDGTNTHVHMLMPLRPLTEEGFGAKSMNYYLVRDMRDHFRDLDGRYREQQDCYREPQDQDRETWLSADELKERLAAGEQLEKVYKYRLGNERRELTPTQAKEWEGCKRVSKTPVQEGRRTTDWDERTKAEEWRERIARRINESLESARIEGRVDHRSYERQGVDRVATLHEGSRVHAMECKAELEARERGIEYRPASDIRRENLSIARFNEQLQRFAEQLRRNVVEPVREQAREFRSRVVHGFEVGLERAHELRSAYMRDPSLDPFKDARSHAKEQRELQLMARKVVVPSRERAKDLARQRELEAQRVHAPAYRPTSRSRGYDGPSL